MLATVPAFDRSATRPLFRRRRPIRLGNPGTGLSTIRSAGLDEGRRHRTKSRYDKLKPGMEKAFDFSAMTATAVGPTWATLSDADKKALTDAFTNA